MKRIAILALFSIAFSAITASAASTEQYLSGYATAILQGKYSLDMKAEVRGGEMFLPMEIADNPRYAEIINDLSQIEGIQAIKLIQQKELDYASSVWLFPGDPLFAPLIADPNWPNFTAGYRYHTKENITRHSLDVSLGGTFSIIRAGIGQGLLVDVGLQGNAATMIDLRHSNLTVYDLSFGLPVTYKWKALSIMTRIYHTSSHLIDDYIFDNPGIQQQDVSYEALQVIASVQPIDWFRIYGGGELYLVPEPRDMEHAAWQAGLEFYIKSDVSKIPDIIAAVNLHGMQAHDYEPSVSVRIGAQFIPGTLVALDFYSGFGSYGQLFREKMQYIGISFSFLGL